MQSQSRQCREGSTIQVFFVAVFSLSIGTFACSGLKLKSRVPSKTARVEREKNTEKPQQEKLVSEKSPQPFIETVLNDSIALPDLKRILKMLPEYEKMRSKGSEGVNNKKFEVFERNLGIFELFPDSGQRSSLIREEVTNRFLYDEEVLNFAMEQKARRLKRSFKEICFGELVECGDLNFEPTAARDELSKFCLKYVKKVSGSKKLAKKREQIKHDLFKSLENELRNFASNPEWASPPQFPGEYKPKASDLRAVVDDELLSLKKLEGRCR